MRKSYSVIESLNWYSYVSNNPVKYVDPRGESGIAIGGAAATAALLEPTPIGEIIIIGAIILGLILSEAKAPEDGVVVEPEKPEDDTVPSEAPDEAATPDTPKPTIEGQKTESSERPKVIDDDTDMSDPSTWPLPEGVDEGELTEGAPSKNKPRARGEKSWYDGEGGEWRPHKPDNHHPEGHWSYKPPSTPKNKYPEWDNIPVDGN